MDDNYPAASDADLMRLARTDPDAFAEVFQRHAREIYDWHFRRTSSPDTSLDLTAETFAQAWQHRARFKRRSDDSAFPWLLGIAQNQFRMLVRKQQVESKLRHKLGMVTEWHINDNSTDLLDDSATQLDALPPDQQAALDLRVMQGMSYREVGKQMGCSEPAARMKVMRGLRQLKRQF